MELLNKYKNGNYFISIYEDGTKVRETEDDEFLASFPECIDLKITNKCNIGCKYCHEDSTIDGLHGDILNSEFINTLRPYTELALGGGNVLEHPDLIKFLEILKEKNIIANITINQAHFMSEQDTIKFLVSNNLIKGLGVSLTKPTDDFVNTVKEYKNVVIHVINGVVPLEDLERLYNNDLKILILGYKTFRRGLAFYSSEIEDNKKKVYDHIIDIVNGFKIVSFDNLAIKQLELERIFSKKSWDEFYMGDDGKFTMYIDLVNEEFSKSSVSKERFELLNNIEDMFKVVKML